MSELGVLGILLFALLVLFAFVGAHQAKQKTRAAWTDLASQTGGLYSDEPRRATKAGWEGGPTVRWTTRGIPVVLARNIQDQSSGTTQFQAALDLPENFQYTVMPKGLIAGLLTSSRLWSFVLASSRGRAGESDREETDLRSVDRMAFLAKSEITTGDPLFDGAFLLKSDDEALARSVFAASGIRYSLHELNRLQKGWLLSLLAAGPSGRFQLNLTAPGIGRQSEALRAGYALVQAAIASLESLRTAHSKRASIA